MYIYISQYSHVARTSQSGNVNFNCIMWNNQQKFPRKFEEILHFDNDSRENIS